MKTKILLLTSILVLSLSISACGSSNIQSGNQQIRNISIRGSGSADISPDIAHVNIGVHSEAKSVRESVSKNNSSVQRVMGALAELGVKSDDLRTSNFSVYETKQYDRETGEVTEILYAVDNNILVTVRDLDTLGTLLDEAIKSGANTINNVQFDVADSSSALKQAREEALSDAIQQAQEMAEAAGITLGEIQTISYYESIPSPAQPAYMDYGKGGGGEFYEARAEVPINPGEMTITASISLIYSIR